MKPNKVEKILRFPREGEKTHVYYKNPYDASGKVYVLRSDVAKKLERKIRVGFEVAEQASKILDAKEAEGKVV